MNMTTTALWARAASASEKVFPSTVVRVKPGAAAPTWGPAARSVPDRARTPARIKNVRKGRMELSFHRFRRRRNRQLFQYARDRPGVSRLAAEGRERTAI